MPAETAYFFGTFNPVHQGHLLMAQTVLAQTAFKKVLFIPAYSPPHRSADELAPFEHRYHMAKLACADNPTFEVSNIEATLPVPSYTVQTLRALIPDFDNLKEPAAVIIGQDALANLGTWHEAPKLIEAVCFLQAPRSGQPKITAIAVNNQNLKINTQSVDMPLIDISSTLIRENIANQKSIRYLTPEPVRRYVQWNGLYQS